MNPLATVGSLAQTLARPAQLLTLAAPSPALARLTPGARFDALAVAGADARTTLLRTPQGSVTVQGGTLPPGAQVTLQVQGRGDALQLLVVAIRAAGGAPPSPQPAVSTTPVHPTALAAATAADAMLAKLLQQVTTAGPEAAGRGASPDGLWARLVDPLIFLYGLRHGHAGSWLGAGLTGLLDRAGRLDTVERGLLGLREQAGRVEHDGWRLMPMLWAAPGEPRTARLWVHAGGGAAEDEPIRFLLELALDPWGRLRFEGFLFDRRFDLILRPERSLPGGLVERLTGFFTRAAATAGLHGRLTALSADPAGRAGPASGPGSAAALLA